MSEASMSEQHVATDSSGEATLEVSDRTRSEWSLAKDTEGVICQTHIGGQALVEGIMMRGRYNWAVAVREPAGTIYLEQHDLVSGRPKNSWLHKPVIRGCTALVESLALGYKALEIASQHAFDFDEQEPELSKDEHELAELSDTAGRELNTTTGAESSAIEANVAMVEQTNSPGPNESLAAEQDIDAKTQKESSEEEDSAIPKSLVTISMVIGAALGIVLFIVLPAFITNLIVGDYAEKTLLWNIIDGILRIAVFIFYIWLIGRMKDIKRMFSYHGAEHKTIHCYEHGLELTVDNARRFPTLHVRCGTAFMLMTMLIAILVFTIVPVGLLIDALGVSNGALRLSLVILSRIILLPVVAGLSYEVTVKWAGSHPESPFVQFILWPGMQMQRLTTKQPDDDMLECAIAAMRSVLEREQQELSGQPELLEPLELLEQPELLEPLEHPELRE